MKILVAGGAGYIGSCCTEYLLSQGHEVAVLDSLVKGHRDAVDPGATFFHADLADTEHVAALVKEVEPEGMIHFAAFIAVGESMTDPGRYFRNNVANGLNLLAAAVACGVRKVVFSSTAAVYGIPNNTPITEQEPEQPINPYGESKLMFEKILRWYHRIHGLDYVALRYFNAAGATERFGEDHDPESHLIPIILEVAAGKRSHISIFGEDYPTPDGTCVRDYIHVLDLARAHLLALESDAVGSFNVGTGTGHSVREVVETARQVTGEPIRVCVVPRRPGDPPRLVSDPTAIKNRLGWQPQHDDLPQIIASAWAWHRKHPNGYDA